MEFTQSAGHKNWTAGRKVRARVNAERLGALQALVMTGWAYPVAVFVALVIALGTVGALESR